MTQPRDESLHLKCQLPALWLELCVEKDSEAQQEREL